MKQWIEFVKNFDNLFVANSLGEETKIQGGNSDKFMSNIAKAISVTRIFNIQDETKKLLMLTNAPKNNSKLRLPYSSMFVDATFSKYELSEFGWEVEGDIEGFIIQEGVLETNVDVEVEVGKTVRLIACIKKDDYIEFNTFNIEMNISEEFKDAEIKVIKPINPKAKKFLHAFTINLINLINDPEIIIIHRDENKERNLKRAKKGKCKIPEIVSVRLDTERKVYVDSLIQGGSFTKASHQWWVRGFWRTLKAERYGHNKGKRQWILPHIRGKGILVEKEYDV